MKYELPVYLFMLVTGVFVSAQPRPAATLIITNATVYTVDKQCSRADAVAAIGDRVVAVGSNAEIDLWRGPQTRAMFGDNTTLACATRAAKALLAICFKPINGSS